MKERIQKLMNAEKMNAAKFADTLGVGRAVISNIMTERNRASLDIVMTILTKMPQISSDWLLFGKGDMYKSNTLQTEAVVTSSYSERLPDLFAQNPIKPSNPAKEPEERKENAVNPPQNQAQSIVTERIVYKERPEKKISRIIVYYSDNTFEVFDAGKLVP
ncbi:MAG: helix-turn-helix domain containing protein [Prevotella sp.]|jgi:transcriptional regulator with XRE-family HTH domain|nr:helix-turn-helix domain containing protein [Prevotella sp.]